jgi:hypothetical protein
VRSGADDLVATPTDLTLADVLAGAAEEAAEVTSASDGDTTTWSAGTPGVVFAVLTADRAEFRLDPLVARAAMRTPGTQPSTRGPDWVAFGPAIVDDGAVDRAEAWFLSAFRRVRTAG